MELPFDLQRAKGFVYQTGVWVPLIVAGPLVQGPTGRSVDALANTVDLFELFGEMAGVNVREVVPPAHTLDSRPMLGYLTDPEQEAIREYNFTQLGPGVFETPANDETRSWPCVLLESACSDILFDTQPFCKANGGVWWGPGGDQEPESSCCAVLEASGADVEILALGQFAVRNSTYKLTQRLTPDCSADDGSFPPLLLLLLAPTPAFRRHQHQRKQIFFGDVMPDQLIVPAQLVEHALDGNRRV